jgi:hypothetical protein
MNRSQAMLALAALALAVPLAQAQGIDSAAMARWGSAKSVDYHVVGVYQAATPLVFGERSAMADVSDRVEIDFKWDLQTAKPIGTPTVRNFPSEVKNLRPEPAGCTAPVLKGPYEHFTATAVAEGLGGDLHMTSERSQPEAQVYAACTGRKVVKAQRKVQVEQFPVPSPVLLAMGGAGGPDLAISADRKSFVHKRGGWTWTYTPTVGR